MIRDWTERNFEFSGYVTGFDPRNLERPAMSCSANRVIAGYASLWRALSETTVPA